MGAEVYSIEIQPALAQRARRALDEAGYTQVHTRTGDGYVGWPEDAPFDVVLLTAAPRRIPQPLLDQLGQGGRLVAPVGGSVRQELVVVTRVDGDLSRREIIPVLFVPMTGRAETLDRPDDR